MAMDEKLPISVCVTTKNNEDTIRECLNSVCDWAGEIVIVDTGSTDGTIEIAKEYGTVYHHDFEGFSDLKKTAIDHASNEWVFILDSDEVVSAELQEEIRNKFDPTSYDAYYLKMRNYMLGKPTHHVHDKRPRLAKKKALFFEEDYLWEKLSIKDEYQDEVSQLNNEIIHYMYDTISEMEEKFIQYSGLEAIRIVDNDMNANLLFLTLKGIAIAGHRLFVKRGILDGRRGLYFAFLSFFHIFSAHFKVRDLYSVMEENPEDWREMWLAEECQR